MQVNGHVLVWDQQLPDWLTQGHFSPNELKAILHEHIRTLVTRYRGRVASWDVAAEAVGEDGKPRETFWSRRIGPDYLALAFRWAHEADPQVRLRYNDYGGEGAGAKSDGITRSWPSCAGSAYRSMPGPADAREPAGCCHRTG